VAAAPGWWIMATRMSTSGTVTARVTCGPGPAFCFEQPGYLAVTSGRLGTERSRENLSAIEGPFGSGRGRSVLPAARDSERREGVAGRGPPARGPGGLGQATGRTAREEQLHYRDFDAFPVSTTMRVLSSLLDSTFLENALFETKH
jgi:hypothetical protein